MAWVGVQRNSATTDKKNVMHVIGKVMACSDPACNTTVNLGDPLDLGTVIATTKTTIIMVWDQANHKFSFTANGKITPIGQSKSLKTVTQDFEYDATLAVQPVVTNAQRIEAMCEVPNRSGGPPVANGLLDMYFDDVMYQ